MPATFLDLAGLACPHECFSAAHAEHVFNDFVIRLLQSQAGPKADSRLIAPKPKPRNAAEALPSPSRLMFLRLMTNDLQWLFLRKRVGLMCLSWVALNLGRVCSIRRVGRGNLRLLFVERLTEVSPHLAGISNS